MRKKFKDMLLENKDKPVGQAVILSMFTMLDGDPRFDNLAELYDGMEEYGNFMTEKEAKKVVDGFIAFDGNRGQKWSMDTISEELRKVGAMPEERHHFNKFSCCPHGNRNVPCFWLSEIEKGSVIWEQRRFMRFLE